MAKDDATRTVLRTAAVGAPAAAHSPAAGAAAPASAELAAFLARAGLEPYGQALCTGLGVNSVAATAFVTDEHLQSIGMKPVERCMFLAAAAAARGAAPVVPAAPAAPLPAAVKRTVSGASPCDVMISYRVLETGDGGDKSVFVLRDALQARGYSVFVGEGAIQGGDSWPTIIQRGVEACQAFVILCSPTYGDPDVSPWTKRELELADNLKKPLLPVWHSGAYPPKPVSIYLGGLQRFPGGNFRDGYVKAEISHDTVVEELVARLLVLGLQPRDAAPSAAPPG